MQNQVKQEKNPSIPMGKEFMNKGNENQTAHIPSSESKATSKLEAAPSCRAYISRLKKQRSALRSALGYIPEQVDLSLPRYKDADDSDTVAIEITVGWLREVRDALALVETK